MISPRAMLIVESNLLKKVPYDEVFGRGLHVATNCAVPRRRLERTATARSPSELTRNLAVSDIAADQFVFNRTRMEARAGRVRS
jgi:hypothetical protein